MGYVKMLVAENLTEQTINFEAESVLDKDVTAIADDWRRYRTVS